MAQKLNALPSPWDREEGAPVSPGPEFPAIREITFDNPYEGPTSGDLPAIPKPITTTPGIPRPENIPLPPPAQPGSGATYLEYIAKAMAQILDQPKSFVTGNVTCLLANQGYQLPSFEIPLFSQVVIQAWFTNVGVIYVAYRQSDAQNIAVGFPLIANAGVGYRIRNTNGVWIMATVAGEGASFTVEQS